jgi:hypothetical protein
MQTRLDLKNAIGFPISNQDTPPLTPPASIRSILERSRPFLRQSVRNASQVRLTGVIREIDIWRVAVLMVKRYADDAEANAHSRADERDRGRSSRCDDLASSHN